MSNKDIPDAALVKWLVKENKQLKIENFELKQKLACKERAIEAFKKWQAKVAEYKWNYWVNEGVEIAKNKPDPKRIELLRSLLGTHYSYQNNLNRLEKIHKALIKESDKYLKDIEK